jgi:hypothetical protein
MYPDPEHYLNPKTTSILLNTTNMFSISKSSTERRKSRRDVREIAFIAVLAYEV